MKPKPAHLGARYAAQFSDAAIVSAYDRRPPYAEDVISTLLGLMPEREQRILDVGCGRGELAIPLTARGLCVDAVDPSAAMLAAGAARPGGDAAALHWIEAPIESAPLSPPYGLATAGESLHWTDWRISIPRIAAALGDGAYLAILARTFETSPWAPDLQPLIERHSTNREYAPYDLIDELKSRGLYVEHGRLETVGRAFSQRLADYVESFHSANGFSRDRMPVDSARAFDDGVAAVVRAHIGGGPVVLETATRIVWGIPTSNLP